MSAPKRDKPPQKLASIVDNMLSASVNRKRAGLRSLVYAASFIELSNVTIETWPDEDVVGVSDEVVGFLRSLVRAVEPGKASAPLTLQGPLTFRSMSTDKRAVTLAWGSARDVMVLQLLSLVQLAGVHTLRVCAAHDCDRLFVRVHKRECCSTTCLNRKTQKAKRDRERVLRQKWEAEQTRKLRKGRR